MLLKAGVDISKLNPQIRLALSTIDRIYSAKGRELVITSTNDGVHIASSLHYHNDAIDIRYIPGIVSDLTKGLKHQLGKDFDVVEEADHLHIEYDPKP